MAEEPKIDWKALEAITKKVLAFKPKKNGKEPSAQQEAKHGDSG